MASVGTQVSSYGAQKASAKVEIPRPPTKDERIITKGTLEKARAIVYQSIVTGQGWKKTVADYYHVADKGIHTVSEICNIANTFANFGFNMRGISTHSAERIEDKKERKEEVKDNKATQASTTAQQNYLSEKSLELQKQQIAIAKDERQKANAKQNAEIGFKIGQTIGNVFL